MVRGLQRAAGEQDVRGDHHSCTPFEVHQAAGSNMAEHYLGGTTVKEGDASILAGKDHAIGTPSDVAAANAVNRVAFTYPRADAPINAVHDDPHTIKAFKALPEADEQGKDTIMNVHLRMPGQTRDPQHLRPTHWR